MTDTPIRRGRGRPALHDGTSVDDEACLRAALTAFADNGFDGTSVREVARSLGISHGLLNAKFGTKTALWRAAVGYGLDLLHTKMSELPDAPDAPGDIVERMQFACRNFVVGLTQVPAIIRLMNIEGAQQSDRLDYITRTFFRGRVWPFHTLLREGQEEGVFRPMHRSIPFTLLAHGAGALVALRPLIDAAVDEDARQTDDGLAAASAAADIIVRGLCV